MTEEEIDVNLKTIRNVMNNFEDELCEKMQERIDEIKNYIIKQSKEIERQKEINKEHQELNGKLQTYIKELEEKVEKYKSTWD